MLGWARAAALATGLLAGGLGLATTVCAQTIDATDAPAVAKALQDFGWQAKLEKGSDGDPKIEGRVSKSSYTIYFYGCTKNTNCASLQLISGWETKGKVSMDTVNSWNRDKRFASAYLDKDGDPHLQLSVNMFGGVTRKNLEDTMDWWRISVTDFEKTIGW